MSRRGNLYRVERPMNEQRAMVLDRVGTDTAQAVDYADHRVRE